MATTHTEMFEASVDAQEQERVSQGREYAGQVLGILTQRGDWVKVRELIMISKYYSAPGDPVLNEHKCHLARHYSNGEIIFGPHGFRATNGATVEEIKSDVLAKGVYDVRSD